MISDIILLGVLGAAFHFLAYRAEATRWLWSRYPKSLNRLLSCSACTGFWIGGALGLLARERGYLLLGLTDWLLLPACALVTMVAAPPLAYLQIYTLTALGGEDAEINKEERP
jgi:hypothetical protein